MTAGSARPAALVEAKPGNSLPTERDERDRHDRECDPVEDPRRGLARNRGRHEEECPGVERHLGGLQVRSVRIGRPLRRDERPDAEERQQRSGHQRRTSRSSSGENVDCDEPQGPPHEHRRRRPGRRVVAPVLEGEDEEHAADQERDGPVRKEPGSAGPARARLVHDLLA